jgi:DNA-directed RNA polymerase specialized sigma24 family protein
MSNEEITKQFYQHLSEVEGGIHNLIYRLGDEYEDAKQDALIKLYTYATRSEIDPNNIKNLVFTTLKNVCIQLTQKRKEYQPDEHYDAPDEHYDAPDYSLLNKIVMEKITQEEYQFLLDYYGDSYGENKVNQSQMVHRIKTKIGYKNKYYELVAPDGATTTHKSLSAISKHIGCDNAYFNKRLTNGQFRYKKEVWLIRTKINFK